MGIKQAIKKIVMGPKASSQDYVNYLRSNGMVRYRQDSFAN